MNLASLANESRLLVEAKLKPIQGSRFQPTGFPDLGPATYALPDGTPMLLVESAQSMANRLEAVCWDGNTNNWIEPLRGLPFVLVKNKAGEPLTNSLLEAHRLNSAYIEKADGGQFHKMLATEIGFKEGTPIDQNKFGRAILKFDVNSLIHGVFLESIAGRLRIPRALTAFIEARNITVAASGGVKNDHVKPGKGDAGQTSKEGFGNIPFHRDEFCGEIIAFFNVDLSQLRGYGFDPAVTELLIALSIFKIQKLLDGNCRLRTACDLVVDGTPAVTRPSGFALPSLKELEAALPKLITAASKNFSEAKDREVTFE
jgi:CRISPR-associated protein Csb1